MSGAIRQYLQALGARMGGLEVPAAQAVLSAWGQLLDDSADRVKAALRAGRLLDAPADAIDPHARTRGFGRVRTDTDEGLRQWLRGVWDYYREMGSGDGMARQLGRLGYSHIRIVSALDLYTAGVVGAYGLSPGLLGPVGGYPGFFHIEIDGPNGFSAAPDWDGGIDWDGSALWDLAEPYTGAVVDIRHTVWRWKPFGRSCRFVRVRVPAPDDPKLALWLTVPVAEKWEWDASGNVSGPYLQDFMVE